MKYRMITLFIGSILILVASGHSGALPPERFGSSGLAGLNGAPRVKAATAGKNLTELAAQALVRKD